MDIQLTGIVHEGTFTSAVYYPRALFRYAVHIPQGATANCALSLTHDGLHRESAFIMEQLAAADEAPWCVTVGVWPGTLPATRSGGQDRNLRMNTYDVFSTRYPDFLVEEFLPYLMKTYDLHISPDPDLHMTLGGSSGGISAWNTAWLRNDFFRRVYMSSPSFLSMGKGDELLNLMRKHEPKPIRVVTEFSEHEPDDYFGSSYCVADAAERALRFAGYDMLSHYFPGEGHCSRLYHPETLRENLRFLWRGWQHTPVRISGYSPRVAEIIPPNAPWQHTDAPFPVKSAVALSLTKDAQGSCFAMSSDKWRLYIGNKAHGCIHAATVAPNGSTDAPYLHAALHQPTEFAFPGAYDLCVDAEDRLYVATEAGIQLVRSYGLIDGILSNPAGHPADEIAIGEDGCLYTRCGEHVYRRPLQGKRPEKAAPTPPRYFSYYDN